MEQEAQYNSSVPYTADLLGNIRSHLAGLQGYDVMALELIQNADDAKAKEIVFDITDSGLIVRNDKFFTYCGDLENKKCAYLTESNTECDYHSIIVVGKGKKKVERENIGRFGIGFVSVYQVTDHPEICSSGIKLTFYPEQERCNIEPFEEPNGTSFFLPWADDPHTETRRELCVSHVSTKDIEQLAEHFQSVLHKSLLFLNNVQKAEVRRNGHRLLACNLDRSEGSGLTIHFQPSGKVERWQILRADATAAKLLFETYPRLESLNRKTSISIGLRIEPAPLAEGLLYAFLPTEQSTGLPLHINADFFPESDRKSVIFKGQHEKAWNEMLIDTAASKLAENPENLLKILGRVNLWRIIDGAHKIFSETSGNHPSCFKYFWERLKVTTPQVHIIETQDGDIQRPNAVFLDRPELNENEAKALLAIGGKLAVKDLRQFWTVMNKLGSTILKLEDVAGLLESVMTPQEEGITEVDEKKLEHFYQPLWSIINELLPKKPVMDPTLQRLVKLPFIISDDMYAISINQSYTAEPPLKANRIAALLPRLAIISRRLSDFENIKKLVKPLDLGAVVEYISDECAAGRTGEIIGVNRENLRELYSLFDDLDRQRSVEKTVYPKLRSLPIWLSNCDMDMVKADQAFLPGGFTDPTGQVVLLETSVLSASVTVFLQTKLDIKPLSIEAYVKNWLPKFFGDNGPADEAKYALLISELAKNYQTLINNEDIHKLLGGFKIVPTRNGGWTVPRDTYRRTDELAKVLGESPCLWLDDSRIPDTMPVRDFIDGLGIRKSPLVKHLVSRILSIAEKSPPNEDARRESSEAFYALCENYEKRKDKETFVKTINDLTRKACFPADGDTEKWHTANSLYTPFRAEAFRRSQAKIFYFKNPQRLRTGGSDLLNMLGVRIPETSLVIKHLQYCVANGMDPHFFTYQVLNERAQSEAPLIKSKLADEKCIYVESQKKFVRPNQAYWERQQLGSYAYTIPDNNRSFKQFYDAIGVKDNPKGKDFIAILLDIVNEYSKQSEFLTDEKGRNIYSSCLSSVANAYGNGELTISDLKPLRETPIILNLHNQLICPDKALLHDSEWHAKFFDGELGQALCKYPPDLLYFLKEVGVKCLSNDAWVELDFVDGLKSEEPLYAEKLKEKIEIIARFLHDRPVHIKKIRDALTDLKAFSYDDIQIKASVNIASNPVFTTVDAFYDERCLILKRPVSDRSWAHILNALFHQLMPEETGNDISKLTANVLPRMKMRVDEAHRELDDIGIPYPDVEIDHVEDLSSPVLDEMNVPTEPANQEESATPSDPVDDPAKTSDVGENHLDGEERNQINEILASRLIAKPPERVERGGGLGGLSQYVHERNSSAIREVDGKGSAKAESSRDTKSRPRHRNEHLRSYVLHEREENTETGSQDGSLERNLTIERNGREAIYEYEKKHGRVVEQMDEMNPGFDIISRNPMTGEERYIELKSLREEWGERGVPLSKRQFDEAQNKGNRFWLYVVEFAGDPNPANRRVFPIQNPFAQVTNFMFDDGWRSAVTGESAESAARIIPGKRIQHKEKGSGKILDVISHEDMKILMVEFDENPEVMRVPLNLSRISILEDSDDENNS